MSDLAAVVLAGGAARRLSGVDKPLLEVGGRSLLARVLAAVGDAPAVVVGPERTAIAGVRWTREDPPGGGPVAALAAGLDLVTAPRVAVLAADLAGITRSTVERVAAAVRGDGAVLVDDEGRRQWLIGVWRTASLRAALPADPRDASVRGVLGGLSITEVAALPGETVDIDTPSDLDRPG